MTVQDAIEKSDLAYWFPKLLDAGVPVPRTQIISLAEEPVRWYAEEDHRKARHPRLDSLEYDLDNLISSEFGYPCFLRTGQGSGKHSFDTHCLVQSYNVLGTRIRNLIEWSAMVDMMGLSCKTWAARELLPVSPVCLLPDYGNMPLVVEQRCFISEGRLVCRHSYWPIGALAQGFHDGVIPAEEGARILAMDLMPAEWEADFYRQVLRVVDAFADDGSWSVDLLLTSEGWSVTDMAVASLSYHDSPCDKKELLK